MAKRKKMKILLGGKPFKKSKVIQPTPMKHLIESSTPCIAYKVPASTFQALIEDQNPNSDTLIGLQFAFRKKSESGITVALPFIDIYQVYFNPDGTFSRFPSDDTGPLSLGNPNNNIASCDIHQINRYDNSLIGPSLSHFGLHPNPKTVDESTTYYTSLDFFDQEDKVGLVYFTIDQLRYLVQEFNYLVISGCQLNLGKKLTHHPNDDYLRYEKPYFTLKIEGVNSIEVPTGKVAGGPIEMPDATIGHPCPPDWFMYSITMGQGIAINPEVDIEAMQASWHAVFATGTKRFE